MNTSEIKLKLNKSLEFLKTELTQIRTGRASPNLIEDIEVVAYGSTMTIKELGSITLLDSQNLVVSPWDKTQIREIAEGIRESGKGLNPVEDSDRIRIPIPSLTEDRRVELARMVSEKVEEVKNSMRHVRQDAMKDVDKSFTAKEIGEDEKFSMRDDIEEVIKDLIAEHKKLQVMELANKHKKGNNEK